MKIDFKGHLLPYLQKKEKGTYGLVCALLIFIDSVATTSIENDKKELRKNSQLSTFNSQLFFEYSFRDAVAHTH